MHVSMYHACIYVCMYACMCVCTINVLVGGLLNFFIYNIYQSALLIIYGLINESISLCVCIILICMYCMCVCMHFCTDVRPIENKGSRTHENVRIRLSIPLK